MHAQKTIGQIIRQYRNGQRMTQVELAKRLSTYGITITFKGISSWEHDVTEPNASTFMYICSILQIPDCLEEFFGTNASNCRVHQYIPTFLSPTNYRKESGAATETITSIRKIKLYDICVSAGTGNVLDSENYSFLDVNENIASGADFAVTIAGDSMEPWFFNHEIVLVHAQETLENGEVGIFVLNGEAYIKKYKFTPSGVYLISANLKYAPIQIRDSDSFRIFGKVCARAN